MFHIIVCGEDGPAHKSLAAIGDSWFHTDRSEAREEKLIEWQPILEAGAKSLLPKIVDSALSAANKSYRERAPYQAISFVEHYEYAYKRCTLIKTIVNGDQPIKLLENYVNPNFKTKNGTIDEYEFIDLIFTTKRVVVTGSAGSGKSMFMRYFWIACSIEPRDKKFQYISNFASSTRSRTITLSIISFIPLLVHRAAKRAQLLTAP